MWTFKAFYNTMERTAEDFTHNQLCRDEFVQGGEDKVWNFEEKENMQKEQQSGGEF